MKNWKRIEKEINDIINGLIVDKNLVKLYKEKSEQILNLNRDSSKVIIQEIFSFDKYDKEEFPSFRYIIYYLYYYLKIFN